MKQAYSIVNSKLLITNLNHCIKRPKLFWTKKFLWCIYAVTIFVLTGFVFYMVLYPQKNLFDTISLGAVFATLGSTLVSIASLLCNKYYDEFISCRDIFKSELSTQEIKLTWIFLKKQEVIRKSKNEYVSYQASNPKVIFQLGVMNLSIEVPVQKKDFYELGLLKKILKMKISKKIYVTYLLNYTDSVMESGLYIWECIYHILCNALFYILYRDLIITGTIFFVSGLIITFLYPIIF